MSVCVITIAFELILINRSLFRFYSSFIYSLVYIDVIDEIFAYAFIPFFLRSTNTVRIELLFSIATILGPLLEPKRQ